MSLDDRLKNAEARMAERLRSAERRMAEATARVTGEKPAPEGAHSPPGLSPTPPASHLLQRVALDRHQGLTLLDELMEDSFHLREVLGASMGAYPTTYCETAREYVEPILADMPMPDVQRTAVLDGISKAAARGQELGILRSLGVHLPGVGCFINGWLMGRMHDMPPGELLADGDGFARIAATAAHEKWGHGFITECTTQGQEKASLQLGMNHLASEFEIRDMDTPEHARLLRQWNIVFVSSQYVEEGYATWVERYLAEQLAASGAEGILAHAPQFTVDALVARLGKAPGGKAAARAIEGLFNLSGPAMGAVHAAMFEAVAAVEAMGDGFAASAGMPAPYALGYCLMDAIATRQGPRCIPYAVATACNIQYGLDRVGNSDLQDYVTRHPELNVNTRLAIQMYVSAGSCDDVRGYLERVHNEAGLAPPV